MVVSKTRQSPRRSPRALVRDVVLVGAVALALPLGACGTGSSPGGASSGGGKDAGERDATGLGVGTDDADAPGMAANDDASGGVDGQGHGDAESDPVTLFTVDVPNLVRRADIVLGKANTAPRDAMALGNGTLGVAAWAASGFTAQLNRSDTFPDRKALGQLVIPGLATLTGATDFAGHVDLYDATLVESGGGMTATTYVRADAPEMIVDVTGADPNTTQTAQIKLWSGRSPATKASVAIATLSETWQDSGTGSTGQTFGVLSGLTVGGRNVSATVVDALTVQVSFKPNADGTFRVLVAAPSYAGGDAMTAATAVLGGDATAASSSLTATHLAWWHDYWHRVGLVEMTSTDGAADYVRNPWSGQPATVIDGGSGATVVASTSAATFAIPTTTGRWYALVPASSASSLPSVTVTGTAAARAITLGSVHIGL
jgi:hypothetical protein